MALNVLAINPGSTSTKVAWFCDGSVQWDETIRHDPAMIGAFERIADQFDFRMTTVLKAVEAHGCNVKDLSAAVGRGGIIDAVPGGTYRVDPVLIDRLTLGKPWDHASNMGGRIAFGLAEPQGIPAFIVDPVSVDELMAEARITGLPEVPRISLVHALNVKATVRRAAADLNMDWRDGNFIVAHLGGGITICAHGRGRIQDFYSGNDCGPMSPERAGSLPAMSVLDLCFSGRWDARSLKRQLAGNSGLKAWSGTSDMMEVNRRVAEGDERAKKARDAMIYQISCTMGMMAASLSGQVTASLFTGGIAYDSDLVAAIEDRVGWIAPCLVYAGEDEMAALCQGAMRVLQGEEEAKDYASSVIRL